MVSILHLFSFLVFSCRYQSLVTADADGIPNVLFIVIDDLRPKLGCYGEDIISPNIDQLAEQSMKFTNAHVQQAVCAPSRVSFLTGRRPDTTRLYDFGAYWRRATGNYTTLPQHFKDHGYFSAGVGKIFHQGSPSNFTFDYPYSWSIPNYWPSTEAYISERTCITAEGKKRNLICPVDLFTQPHKTLPDIQNADYAVELLKNISDGAPYIDFFGRNETMKEPFFVGLGLRKPHVPYKYPKEFRSLYPINSISLAPDISLPKELPTVAFAPYLATLDHYEDIAALNLSFPYGPMPIDYHYLIRQSYYASISYMDYQLGRVLSALDTYGFSKNTIISFVGDHGWQLGEHSEFSKFTNYVYATNVPLLFHVPGVTDKGVLRAGRNKFPLIDPLRYRRKPQTWLKPIPSFMSIFGQDGTVAKYHKREKHTKRASDALVELVDMFPTVSDLAGIHVPKICPDSPFRIKVCREGVSLASIIRQASTGSRNLLNEETFLKNCTMSQYPRPSNQPQKKSILPPLRMITIMGYSMRTVDYRYAEWVGFNHTTFQKDWNDVRGKELYILAEDPQENQNVVDHPQYKSIVDMMSQRLHKGWKNCLSSSEET